MLTIPLHETTIVKTLSIAVELHMTSYIEDFYKRDLPQIKRVFEDNLDGIIDEDTIEIKNVLYYRGSSELENLEVSNKDNRFLLIRKSGTHLIAANNKMGCEILFNQFSELIKSGECVIYECNFIKDKAVKIDYLKDNRIKKYL